MLRSLARLVTSQAAGCVLCSTAVTLTAIHPLIHHLENGTLDAILDYAYAYSLNAMKDY